jgi:hypothetical protein
MVCFNGKGCALSIDAEPALAMRTGNGVFRKALSRNFIRMLIAKWHRRGQNMLAFFLIPRSSCRNGDSRHFAAVERTFIHASLEYKGKRGTPR